MMSQDTFNPLLADGPSWNFIKKFDNHKDGRRAVFALKMQAEGTFEKITQKNQAYPSIASSANHHGLQKVSLFPMM
jgi:hypothetical protein